MISYRDHKQSFPKLLQLFTQVMSPNISGYHESGDPRISIQTRILFDLR